jgi:hypothetical protein
MEGHPTGIEHTEAVPHNEAHRASLRQKTGCGRRFHFVSYAQPGEPRKSRAELLRELDRDDPGRGWAGDSVELEWVQAMLHFVERKRLKMREPNFDRFDANWILIYDNWPRPTIDKRSAARSFHESLVSNGVFQELTGY